MSARWTSDDLAEPCHYTEQRSRLLRGARNGLLLELAGVAGFILAVWAAMWIGEF